MTDRDLEIGRLQATVEGLRNQNADQYKRIDALEVDVARIVERVETKGAAGTPTMGAVPLWVYDRKTWLVLLAVLGLAAGWWNLDDIKTTLLPTKG